MKINNIILLMTLLFSILNFHRLLSQDTICFKVLNLYELHGSQPEIDFFYHASFSLPNLLASQALQEKNLIVVLPDYEINITPLEPESISIEGSRIATTWLSIYYRFFKNIENLRILYIPKDTEFKKSSIAQAIKLCAGQTILENQNETAEEKMARRLFKLRNLLNTTTEKNIELKEITITPLSKESITKKIISPLLPEKLSSQKRILVTGGAGFIGSHSITKLLEGNNQVIVLDNLSCCSMENINPLLNNNLLYFEKHDVTEPFTIEGPIDEIIHLASVPSPEMYYNFPIETMKSGLQGTQQCLELAVEKNARFLFASTSEVYGDPEINPQPEEYPGNVSVTGKRSQYDQSKRGGETLCKIFADTHPNLDIRIVRIFNTYGPNMRLGDGRVVTNFINAALNNKPLLLYGGGSQTRSFAYVSDTVDGILKTLESEKISSETPLSQKVFNIGNPDEFTINDLAHKVQQLTIELIGRPCEIISIDQFDLTDPKLRCPNIARAKKILDFNPQVSLEKGLKETFLYFLKKNPQ